MDEQEPAGHERPPGAELARDKHQLGGQEAREGNAEDETPKDGAGDGDRWCQPVRELWRSLGPGDRVDAGFQAVLLLLGAVAAWVTFRQLVIMREAMKASERPWVVLEGLRFKSIQSGPPKKVVFEVVLTNAGKGPALDLRSNIGGGWDTMPAEAPAIEDAGSRSTLAGGKNHEATLSLPFDPNTPLFVVGTAVYRDQFGESHRTTFCAYRDKEADVDPREWTFSACSSLNAVD